MGLGGVDRQRDLLPEIARGTRCLNVATKSCGSPSMRAEVDRAADRGRLDHVDDPMDGVLRRHLEWRRPRDMQILGSNAERDPLPEVLGDRSMQRLGRVNVNAGLGRTTLTVAGSHLDVEQVDAWRADEKGDEPIAWPRIEILSGPICWIVPSRMTAMRSPSAIASDWSWVT